MVELGDICKLEYGYTASAQKHGSHRFIRITDIDDSGFLKEKGKKYINLENDANKFILNKDDILTARTGATHGKTLLFEKDEPAIFASYLIRLRFFESK